MQILVNLTKSPIIYEKLKSNLVGLITSSKLKVFEKN